MVELVDTRRSERRGSNIVRVRLPLSPQIKRFDIIFISLFKMSLYDSTI